MNIMSRYAKQIGQTNSRSTESSTHPTSALATNKSTSVNSIVLFSLFIITVLYISQFFSLYSAVWNDDHYMYLRYAKNFAEGNGIGYNLGQHDEGASDLLFVVLIGIIYKFTGLDLFFISKFVGWIFASVLFVVLFNIVSKYVTNKYLLAASLLFIAFDSSMVVYASLGVSNTLFLSMLFLSIYCFVEDKKFRVLNTDVPVYLFFTALTLFTRQEGIFLVVAVFCSIIFRGYLSRGKLSLRELVMENWAEFAVLLILIVLFFGLKFLYFGDLISPPGYRKFTPLDKIPMDSILANFLSIASLYYFLIPGLVAFYVYRNELDKKLICVTTIYALLAVLFRIAIQFDLGRYFNQVSILLYVISFIGYYHFYVKKVQSSQILKVLFWGFLLFSFYLSTNATFVNLKTWASSPESFPFNFAYVPAGQFIEAHSCSSAVVSSSEVGAIAYYSNREFLDLSGLTDYRYAKIWRANHYELSEDNFGSLYYSSVLAISSNPAFTQYYQFFFDAHPDFVFVIANPPSLVLFSNPKFKDEYVPIWIKTRNDTFRGYYAIYARTNSTCLINLDLSKIIINDQTYPRSVLNDTV